MSHSHGHQHSHGRVQYNRAFSLGVVLNVAYIIVEVAAGLWVNSLALLADAGHNLSDVLGLLLAWGGAYLASIPPTERHTYGWRSSSILAALLNGLLLLVVVGGIVWEAIGRFWDPHAVAGVTLMWVAGAGVLVNGATALLFFGGRHRDLNIKGAFLHMAADAAVSLGVVIGGAGILLTQRGWIDPLVSLLVAAVIFWSTWGLLKESLNLALQAVPPDIEPEAVQQYLESLPGVTEVHDLHVWAMSTTETALTVHLIKPQIENEDGLLQRACSELHDRFGIEHVTIQIERSAETAACLQAGKGTI